MGSLIEICARVGMRASLVRTAVSLASAQCADIKRYSESITAIGEETF